jgi:Cu-Zn family superoxide dismutase
MTNPLMHHPVRTAAALVAALAVSPLAACGGSTPPPEAPAEAPMGEPATSPADMAPEPSDEAPAAAPEAAAPAAPVTVTLEAKSGSKLTGQATLTETATGVKVDLTVEGISPGQHGAHFHEKGDCSAPDGKSAGDHFNPGAHPHALPEKEPRHLGDMGNIEVGKDGKGTLSIEIPGANLKPGDPNSYRGRAIIIHEKKDDGGQPTGNAGGRIGCGVVPS